MGGNMKRISFYCFGIFFGVWSCGEKKPLLTDSKLEKATLQGWEVQNAGVTAPVVASTSTLLSNLTPVTDVMSGSVSLVSSSGPDGVEMRTDSILEAV